MEPGWPRAVVAGVIAALWIAGYGLLEIDDGGRFMDGVVSGLYVVATWMPFFLAYRIAHLGARFVVVLIGVTAVGALFQVVENGSVEWLWTVLPAAVLAIVSVAFDSIGRLRRTTPAA